MPQAISTYSAFSVNDSQINKYLFGINSINKNKQDDITTAYAKKGEPMYQKDMDTDEDGVITFDEFKKYCDDNDISVSQRKQMLKDRIHWHLLNKTQEKSKEIRKEKPKTEKIFAEEGDKNYKEEMDSDNDGKITYEEYVKYCEEVKEKQKNYNKNIVTKDNDNITVVNLDEAITTYSQNDYEPHVEAEG